MRKIKWIAGLVLLGGIGFAIYFLDGALPIGTGYSAKYLCSQVFLAARDPAVVFENDVKPTHPLFRVVRASVDYNEKSVTARAFGFWKSMTAVYRDGCGCTLAVDTDRQDLLAQARGLLPQKKADPQLLWPAGERVDLAALPPEIDPARLNRAVEEAFTEPGPETKRNTQAIVVVYKGRIVAERYAPQFDRSTPMLGWSMSKSVTNALVGLLVKEGRLDIRQPAPVPEWSAEDDPRRAITLDQLLRMSSGLAFEESYAPFADATDMLYASRSMARFAAEKPLRTAPDAEWYYSSGTANILARIVRDTVGGTLTDFCNFARQQLFDRIGMYSAIIEPDASGSPVGSSYMFATARDWARFGLLVNNRGVWRGEQILPPDWVAYSTTPTPLAPQGKYGAQFWLNAGTKDHPEDRLFPSLPADLFYLGGFNFQIVAGIPSKDLVVVRLGVTHDDSWSHEAFIRQIVEAVGAGT